MARIGTLTQHADGKSHVTAIELEVQLQNETNQLGLEPPCKCSFTPDITNTAQGNNPTNPDGNPM